MLDSATQLQDKPASPFYSALELQWHWTLSIKTTWRLTNSEMSLEPKTKEIQTGRHQDSETKKDEEEPEVESQRQM